MTRNMGHINDGDDGDVEDTALILTVPLVYLF